MIIVLFCGWFGICPAPDTTNLPCRLYTIQVWVTASSKRSQLVLCGTWQEGSAEASKYPLPSAASYMAEVHKEVESMDPPEFSTQGEAAGKR